jgi:hypothetical protein
MRYFFPQELKLFMSLCNLRLLALRAFSDLERPPSEATWSALVFAQAETTTPTRAV